MLLSKGVNNRVERSPVRAMFSALLGSAVATYAMDLDFANASFLNGAANPYTQQSQNTPAYVPTRNSQAMMLCEDGVSRYAPHNLAPYSDGVGDGWIESGLDSFTGGLIVPSALTGQIGALEVITEDKAALTLCMKLSSANHDFFMLNLRDTTNEWVSAVFDLTAGSGEASETAVGATSGEVLSTSITDHDDGSFTLILSAKTGSGLSSRGVNWFYADAATGNSFNTNGRINSTTTNADTFQLDGFGVQAFPAAFPDQVVPTSGAVKYDGPRMGARNCKPVTNLEDLPCNIEEKIHTRASPSAGQADPFGGNNASKIVENTDSASHYSNLSTKTLTDGVTYTTSIYFKNDGRDFAFSITGIGRAHFDGTNGVVGQVDAGFLRTGIIPVLGFDGWYRVYGTYVAASTNNILGVLCDDAALGSIGYGGDGVSGAIVHGFQTNEGEIEDFVGNRQIASQTPLAVFNATLGASSTVDPAGGTDAQLWSDDGALTNDNCRIRPLQAATFEAEAHNWVSIWFRETSATAPEFIKLHLANFGVGDRMNWEVGTENVFFRNSSTSIEVAQAKKCANGWYHVLWKLPVIAEGGDVIGDVLASWNNVETNGLTVTTDGSWEIEVFGSELLLGGATLAGAPHPTKVPATAFVKTGNLREYTATNLITRSQDLSDAYWVKDDCVITNDTTVLNPITGEYSSYIMTSTDLGGTGRTSVLSGAITGAVGPITHWSVVQYEGGTWFAMRAFGFDGGSESAWFNLKDGYIGTVNSGITNVKMRPLGGGKYLTAITVTPATDATGNLFLYAADADGSINYNLGDQVRVFHTQVENNYYPTSPIITNGATETRNTDALTTVDISSFSFFDGSSPYTISSEVNAIYNDDDSGWNYLGVAGIATENAYFTLQDSSTRTGQAWVSAQTTVGGAATLADNSGQSYFAPPEARIKQALSLDVGEFLLAANNSQEDSETGSTTDAVPDPTSFILNAPNQNNPVIYIKNVRLEQGSKTAAALLALTQFPDGTAYYDERLAA